jgi:hypothetical protein
MDYVADGTQYGYYEDTGDTYPVCDVCGDIGLRHSEGKDCQACVEKWEKLSPLTQAIFVMRKYQEETEVPDDALNAIIDAAEAYAALKEAEGK